MGGKKERKKKKKRGVSLAIKGKKIFKSGGEKKKKGVSEWQPSENIWSCATTQKCWFIFNVSFFP